MANQEWDDIDKKTNTFSEVHCAFIDILGYKDKVQKFFNNEYNLMGRIERAIKNTYAMSDITSLFTDISEREITIFSDSIVITYPSNDDNLLILLNDIQNISTHLSMENLFVRGGIAKGKHISKKIDSLNFPFLASEALQKAYFLEQDEEKKPRVLVDIQLIESLNEIGYDRIIKENEKYFVHFASILIDNNTDKQAVKLEMEDIFKNINNKNNQDVNEKFHWILDYYYWTLLQDGSYNKEEYSKFKSKEYEKRNFNVVSR